VRPLRRETGGQDLAVRAVTNVMAEQYVDAAVFVQVAQCGLSRADRPARRAGARDIP
jgi:hypothetical protein